jgi:hypothetical protein
MPTERQMREFRERIEHQETERWIDEVDDAIWKWMCRVPNYFGKKFRVLLLDPQEPTFGGLEKYLTTGKETPDDHTEDSGAG